jgi:hypothetical protein
VKNRKSPQQKKALAYKRDRRITAEYPHAFRRYWPLKKARANRKYRRQVALVLDDVKEQVKLGDDEQFHVQSMPVHRNKVQKWEPDYTLRQWVDSRLERRIERIAWNFFKQPYESALHRERFVNFISAVTQGRSISSRKLAVHFGELLQPPEVEGYLEQWPMNNRKKRICLWLQAFFRDEPEWEGHLRNWVKSFSQ